MEEPETKTKVAPETTEHPLLPPPASPPPPPEEEASPNPTHMQEDHHDDESHSESVTTPPPVSAIAIEYVGNPGAVPIASMEHAGDESVIEAMPTVPVISMDLVERKNEPPREEDVVAGKYMEVFQILSKRSDAWAGVFEEVQTWLQDTIAHEKANAAALKRLPSAVTAVDSAQTQHKTAVHALAAVLACTGGREATERLTLARHVNVETSVKVANLVQDAQKRARTVREKGDALGSELRSTRARLKEIAQRHANAKLFVRTVGDAAHTSVAPADPWLAERQLVGEAEAEAKACRRISDDVVRELQLTKEGEAQRALLLRSTLLKYLHARKEMLARMQQDVDAAMHAVEDVDAEGDWRHFVTRFPILEEYRSMSLVPTTAPEPETQRVGAVLKSGHLLRQGKLYGTSPRYFVLSKHGYLHEFATEMSLNPEESFPLIPGRFEVKTVTPESFEFCYRFSLEEQQQRSSLFGLFGASEVRMVLMAANKDEMVSWLTAIHDFSLRRDYKVVRKTASPAHPIRAPAGTIS